MDLEKLGFYKLDKTIDNHKLEIFSYRLTDFENFKKYNLYEYRGLTKLYKNNKLLRTFYNCPKFFNLNQVPETDYKILKNLKIKNIYEKLDGSLINFVKINDKVYAKSKTSFDSFQAKKSQELYENSKDLKEFVDKNIDNYNLIFEYTSPENQIVVKYNDVRLTLLMVRDLNGNFVDLDNFDYKFKPKKYNKSLDEIIKYCDETNDDFEGFVVEFANTCNNSLISENMPNSNNNSLISNTLANNGDKLPMLVKVKTKKYLILHNLVGYENLYLYKIIDLVLSDEIDDLISNLTDIRKNEIKKIIHNVNEKYIEILEILKTLDYNLSKKDFAIKYKDSKMFNLFINAYIDISKNSENSNNLDTSKMIEIFDKSIKKYMFKYKEFLFGKNYTILEKL